MSESNVNSTEEIVLSVEMGDAVSAQTAEAYAVGKRGGVDVAETDPTWHNNAKYYAEQAEEAAGEAQSAEEAAQRAEAAQAAAEDVAESIPADYSQLSDDVSGLKSALDNFKVDCGYAQLPLEMGKSITNDTSSAVIIPSNITSENGFCCLCIPCQKGDVYSVTGTGGNSTRLWAFSDANGARIEGSAGSASATDLVLTAPDGSAYFSFNSKTNNGIVYSVYSGRKPIRHFEEIEVRIDNLESYTHKEVTDLDSGITALMLGNAPTKQIVIGKRRSSSIAYSVMQINVEAGRRYRIDMSNIDALVGASLYLRLRKADNSGNAYTAHTISGDIPANTKWTYYFNCTVTESVDVQIYRTGLTEDAIFSVGVLCDDDQRDISKITSDLAHIGGKVDMDISRNLIGPDLDVLYPVAPLNDNDVITISAFNPASVNSYTHVEFCRADGTNIKYYQFDSSFASTGRQVTLGLDGETAYFIKLWHDCGSPLMVERGTKTDFIPHYTTNYEKYLNSNSNFGEFELFLPEQAEIIRNNLATARMAKRLCFGHVSDNHSTADKFISDIVDISDAKFIANTGDIVQDKFQDAYTTLPAMINAMTKPYYITLGNHDVYKAPSVSDIFDKYFAPIIDHNGQTGLDKTYYSVDFTDEGIKCIFLDLYDAIADYSVSMESVIAGKMSATQINWFLDQLDAALSSHMHVCVFLHLSPEIVGEKELKFFDVNTAESNKATYTFIPDVIDAFLDGGSVAFNYDGNSYTHTFASSGVFVGYFCGHMHCDCIGKLKTHNRQNAFSVTRPWQSSATNTITDGTYRHGSSKWGSHTFNYVTVDPTTRHVSVMRVLQQETKYGFKRDFVTMEY